MKVIEIKPIKIDKLVPHPVIERRYETDRSGLIRGIKEHTIINQPMVRQRGDKYEIIAGHGRVEGAKANGYKEVECKVVECTDGEAIDLSLQENVVREDYNPADEGRLYDYLEREYLKSHPDAGKQGGNKKEQTEENWAEYYSKKKGISKFRIYRCLRIFRNLDEEIKKKVVKRANFENQKLDGKISEETADQLQRIKDKNVRREVYKIIVKKNLISEQVAQIADKWEDGENIGEILNIDEWSADYKNARNYSRELKKILGTQNILKLPKKESKEMFEELAELKRSINNVLSDLKEKKK